MVKNNHKLVGKEDDTISFVKVDFDDYLYDEDGADGGGIEEEYDISFGLQDMYAVKSGVEKSVNRKYKTRVNHYGSSYEGYDDIVGAMNKVHGENHDSQMDNHPSSMLRQVFMNHLMLEWAQEGERRGKRYQRQGSITAPYSYSFAGVRGLVNEGSSNSSGDITVRTYLLKRDGELRRYRVRDIITNVWDNGRLCSWTRDSSRFTEGRNETMYSPRAIYRYYDTMLQGISNLDLAGANRTRIKRMHLRVVFEDYKENYLLRLEDNVRKDVAIAFVDEKIRSLRADEYEEYEVTSAELSTLSDYSERFYMEFAN